MSKILNWNPKHGKRKAGRPKLTYIDLMKQDTGLEEPDIKTAMHGKVWRDITVRANVSTLSRIIIVHIVSYLIVILNRIRDSCDPLHACKIH